MDNATVSVRIDKEVNAALKVMAAQEGTTVKELIERALVAYYTRWPRVKARA
jgi:predicted HicB family RNase H-like nuclease